MLNEVNRKTFDRLAGLLRSICPEIPLPLGFEQFLWEHMKVEPLCKVRRVLEWEGLKPKKAYYVVSGLVLVQGYADGLPYTASIYREHTIVAMNAFMKGKKAIHQIIGTRDAMVWSIRRESMLLLYQKWPEMKAMALQTALDYIELKKIQRSALLALCEEERVARFYQVFKGLLPPKQSPLRDKEIASYLSVSEDSLRWYRLKLRQLDLLK